jgi:ATP-dependent helicase/nuclease subunit A
VANLEKVSTLARQAGDLGVLTLRGFANLLAERVASAREEPDLPSTRPGDPDTVRVLSVHKAKGLEAPIVALYDTADRAWFSADTIPLWDQGRIAVGFREGCQPEGWADLVQREKKKAWAENRRLLYVACTRARDLLVVPRPPVDAALGDFWRDLVLKLPASSDADVRLVDAETLPIPEHESQRAELWALAGAEGGDAVAARWGKERRERIETAAERRPLPIGVTALAAREEERTPAVAVAERTTGREFGQLVHRLLEWVPFGEDEDERRQGLQRMASAWAPSLGLDDEATARAWQQVDRALGLPVIDRARRAPRTWRELKLWFPDGEFLVEGQADLVFEEDGGLVVVDYKSDAITEEQAQQQAAYHAPQLQLYGRGLSQALGQPVRERLVLFTALGRTVPV